MSREPLPPLEGFVSELHATGIAETAPVCSHTKLNIWDEAEVYRILEARRSKKRKMKPTKQWLPPHLAETVQSWAWPDKVLKLPRASEDEVGRTKMILIAAETGDKEDGEDDTTTSDLPWKELEANVDTMEAKPRIFVFPEESMTAEGRIECQLSAESTGIPVTIEECEKGDPTNAAGGEKETTNPDQIYPPLQAWPAPRVLPRPFVRFWTPEQRKRQELDKLLAASNLPTSYEKAVAEARRKGLPKPDEPIPEGAIRDELMSAVFCAVDQWERFLSARHSQRVPPFLWEAIHPQGADGRPCINPEGTYFVRLWCAGAWRAVQVDDSMPLNAKGECVLPTTGDVRELWPLLLSKAVYSLLGNSPLGYSPAVNVGGGAAAAGLTDVTVTQDRFSLKFQGAAHHDGSSSLAFGGIFSLALQALTSWHPDTPKSLTRLTLERPPSLILPPQPSTDIMHANFTMGPNANNAPLGSPMKGFVEEQQQILLINEGFPVINGSGSGDAVGTAAADPPPFISDDVDDETAARALIRHLIDDGLPCAPLEQFKYDEIFRASVAAALGKDPFLVGNNSAKKWPRPPSQMRRGAKKKVGAELLQSVRAAREIRDQRVKEIVSRLFDLPLCIGSVRKVVPRTRVYALCAATPPTELLGFAATSLRRGTSGHGSRPSSRANSRRSSRRGSSRASSRRSISRRSRESIGPSNAAENAAATTPVAPENHDLDGSDEESDDDYDDDDDSEDYPSTSDTDSEMSTTLGGSSIAGSIDLFDEMGNPLQPQEQQDLVVGAAGNGNGEKASEQVVSKKINSAPQRATTPSSPSLSSTANFVRAGIRFATPPEKDEKISPTLRCTTHVILAVGLRSNNRPIAVSDVTDLNKDVPGGDARTIFSERRWEWIRYGSKNAHIHADVSSAGSIADHDSFQSQEDLAPEPKLLVFWRDPEDYPSMDEDSNELPDFSPSHPAMAKGNLRWITASKFIRSKGGSSMVSLVRMATRNSMVSQAQKQPAPSSLLSPHHQSAANVLTLRHHWVPQGRPPDDPPAIDESLTSSVNNGSSQGAMASRPPAVESLNAAYMRSRGLATAPEDMSSTFLRVVTRESPSDHEFNEGETNVSRGLPAGAHNTFADDPACKEGGIRLMIAVETDTFPEMPFPPAALAAPPDFLGSIEIFPVPFLAPEPSDEDDDDEEEDEAEAEEEKEQIVEKLQSESDSQDSNGEKESTTRNEDQVESTALATSLLKHGTMAWVTDWVPHESSTMVDAEEDVAAIGTNPTISGDQRTTASERPLRAKVPSGCYENALKRGALGSGASRAVLDGVVRMKLKPVVPDDAAFVNDGPFATSALRFPFSFVELLLPELPRAPRASAGPSSNSQVDNDYFFQVRCNFPCGGLVHFACSKELKLGSAADVWGSAHFLRSSQGDESSEDADAAVPDGRKSGDVVAESYGVELSDGKMEEDRWPHARSCSGKYPGLGGTMNVSSDGPRDRRGGGDFHTNRENWAILFRRQVSVLPENGRGAGAGGRYSSAERDVGCRLKLHLADPVARPYVRLVTYYEPKSGKPVTTEYLHLETPPLRWRSDVKAEGYIIMAILEKKSNVVLGPGSWSLTVLSDAPITPLLSLEAAETRKEAREAQILMDNTLAEHRRFKSITNNEGSRKDKEGALGSRDVKNDQGSDDDSTNTASQLALQEQVVWKLPHSPMARARRWSGLYTPNRQLRLLDDHLTESAIAGIPLRNGRGPIAISLRIEVFPQLKSPILNYALRLKVFKRAMAASSPNPALTTPLSPLKHFDGAFVPAFDQRAGMVQVADIQGQDKLTIEMLTLPADHSGLYLELSFDARRMTIPDTLRGCRPFSMCGFETQDVEYDDNNTTAHSAITWACPKWRLIVLPSTSAQLTLSPDSSASDFAKTVKKKWLELRGGSNKVLSKPFWLKANDMAIAERRKRDASTRAQYKLFADRLRKGHKGKTTSSSHPSASSPSNLEAWNSKSDTSDTDMRVLQPFEIVDRLFETSELQLMFNEDDRSATLAADAIRNEIKKSSDQMGNIIKGLHNDFINSMKQWASDRARYREASIARVEAHATMLKMAEAAKALEEGEKGLGINVGGGGKKKGKEDKKGKKKSK